MADHVPGFIPLVLRLDDVSLLRADESVFTAMVDGWRAQMLARSPGCGHNQGALLQRSRTTDGLDLHSFRRSYITYLIEDGWDAKFVQDRETREPASCDRDR